MKTETLLDVLAFGLRAAETVLRRRRPSSPGPDSHADRLVRRVLPVAEKALDRVDVARPRPVARRRRRGLRLHVAASTIVGAAAAAAVAYVVVKQQQRVRERYHPLRASFAMELLDVLSAPGGGGRLECSGSTLVDRHSRAVYSIIDGIPDFIAPRASPSELLLTEDSWVQDFVRPVAMFTLGRDSAGNAALATSVAAAAGEGWVLSVPSGRGTYEIEMARANPRAHVLCLRSNWDVLLEVRRQAHVAGLTNLYFVRGVARLLPLHDHVIGGLWSGAGLHRFREPERELTQMVRVTRPGAQVAGLSLVQGGPLFYDTALRLAAAYLPGLRGLPAYTALLEAVGLHDVRLFRDGAFVRFTGIRA